MGIMDFIKGELIDVIEWTDDSRDTLSWRFPDDDKAIKNGAQLIVRESQVAQFVYLGEFGDTFGPGKHTLTTDNIPVLTKIKSWKYGFNSPFKADVYFVITRLFTGVAGCEITGFAITPDRRTMFINVQHPGDGNPSTSNFPSADRSGAVPRDCTVVITRKDGGIIGS